MRRSQERNVDMDKVSLELVAYLPLHSMAYWLMQQILSMMMRRFAVMLRKTWDWPLVL